MYVCAYRPPINVFKSQVPTTTYKKLFSADFENIMSVIASNAPLFPAHSPRRELSKRIPITPKENKKRTHCGQMQKLFTKSLSAHMSNKATQNDNTVETQRMTSSGTCESLEMHLNRRDKATADSVLGRQEAGKNSLLKLHFAYVCL